MENREASTFLQRMQQVETLIEEIEHCTDEKARSAAQDLMRAVLDLHRAAFSRVRELLGQAGEAGGQLLHDCSVDELVGNVLLLHGLHPQDLKARILAALDKVRPYLHSHGGKVELVDVVDGT